MADGYNQRNVIAVTFPEEASAYEALSRLKDLDSRGDVDIHAKDLLQLAAPVNGKHGGIDPQRAAVGGLGFLVHRNVLRVRGPRAQR